MKHTKTAVRLVLVGGGPDEPAIREQIEKAGVGDKVELVEFHLAAMLARVREATFHRATIWQGVDAQPVKWIDPAVRALAPLVEDGIGGAAALQLNVPTDNARRLEQLACALPEAVFLALVWPRLLGPEGRVSIRIALLGGAIAALAIPVTPPGVPILLAGLGVLAGRR